MNHFSSHININMSLLLLKFQIFRGNLSWLRPNVHTFNLEIKTFSVKQIHYQQLSFKYLSENKQSNFVKLFFQLTVIKELNAFQKLIKLFIIASSASHPSNYLSLICYIYRFISSFSVEIVEKGLLNFQGEKVFLYIFHFYFITSFRIFSCTMCLASVIECWEWFGDHFGYLKKLCGFRYLIF